MPTQRDFSNQLLFNLSKTTQATTGTYVDLGASPSIAKRECKVMVAMSLVSGTAAIDYVVQECATTGGTYAAAVTADTTAALSAAGIVENHYWITKRFVRLILSTVTTGSTGANVFSTIQYLNRSA